MMKRQTTKTRRRSRSKVLEVRVMSPRIAWFGFLRIMMRAVKLACLAAVVTGLGYGVWRGIQHAFYENPDFRLQAIDLNPNPVIDEAGLVEAANIDLTASLFDLDVNALTETLNRLPEISSAKVERHLPGTLVVRVVPRTPQAWISCPDAGLPAPREAGAMLVDHDGIAYRCPARQLDKAVHLPIIELSQSEEFPIAGGQKIRHPELKHSIHLLRSAADFDPESIQWIESITQINAWSLLLVTRDGTRATFGLGDHERQIHRLRAAVEHAATQNYAIGTINLIPRRNVPITLRSEAPAPRAIPIAEPTDAELRDDRRSRDLQNLLNRN